MKQHMLSGCLFLSALSLAGIIYCPEAAVNDWMFVSPSENNGERQQPELGSSF